MSKYVEYGWFGSLIVRSCDSVQWGGLWPKNSEIVTRWPKAPNLVHAKFRSIQTFLEGVPEFKGQGQVKVKMG